MDDVLDGRLTEPIEVGYIYEENVGAAAPDFAREKLGIIEDLIESGELIQDEQKGGGVLKKRRSGVFDASLRNAMLFLESGHIPTAAGEPLPG